jgi:acyl-CoA hydrolase
MSIWHIAHTREDVIDRVRSGAVCKVRAWCGKVIRPSMEMHFAAVDHALYTIASGGAPEPCQDCVHAVEEMLGHTRDKVVREHQLRGEKP